MDRVAVLIDGGYLTKILQAFKEPPIDHGLFAQWASGPNGQLFRTYYYDCLPYQSRVPTEAEKRLISRKQSFFAALRRIDRFTVREGRLEYRGVDDKGNPVFIQKRLDLQMGLDIATLVFGQRVDMIVLVSGDSDLIPAVELAKNNGVLVRLIHGPRSEKTDYHQDLWDLVDERREITDDVIQRLLRDRHKK